MNTRRKLLITYIIFVMVPLILFYTGIQFFSQRAKTEFESRIEQAAFQQDDLIKRNDESMLSVALDGIFVDGIFDEDEKFAFDKFMDKFYRRGIQLFVDGEMVFESNDFEESVGVDDSRIIEGELVTAEGFVIEYISVFRSGEDFKPPGDFFRDLGNNLLIAFIISYVIINVVFIQYAFRHLFSPLTDLINVADSIKSGKYDYPIDNHRKDELGDVFDAFSEMQDELGKAKEIQLQYENNRKELIANISHDLKTPIAAINGYINGIADGVADTPEKLDRYTNIIKGYVKEMDVLIKDLTTLSQFDVDQMQFSFEEVNINSYLEDCVEELSFEMVERSIQLNYTSDVSPDTTVKADREKLKRVINNIVFNSMKHFDKDKKTLGINLLDEGDHVHIAICDNGCGIPKDKLDRIFERFYRVDEARNRAGGNGLGLSIAKHIVMAHEGEIWAASEEGSGTSIHFTVRKW